MIEQRYPFVEIGGATDPGRKRIETPNQDAIGMIEPNAWLRRPAGLIVSDGMGGYNGGEIASRTAIETFPDGEGLYILKKDEKKKTVKRRQIGRASLGKECRSRWSPYH